MRVPHPLMVTGKTIRIGIIAIFLATSPALAANPVYHIVDLGELNAAGINASGEVTGTAQGVEYAFLYNGTTVQNLGTLGGDDSFGYAINDSGEVTGASHTTGNGPSTRSSTMARRCWTSAGSAKTNPLATVSTRAAR
jgi:probable HAF family extracellular repeat protein